MLRFAVLILCLLFQFAMPLVVFAQSEEEKKQLAMYFSDEELQVVSATRALKPINRVAENMTVITSEDIERMNAHSLDEVLDTVVGIQLVGSRTPGNRGSAVIQGSEAIFVTVMMDGVVMNVVNNYWNIVGTIPVQQIERVEIIKGPASSTWGSALGGVINIITKGPPDKGVTGMASGTYGSNHTEDIRAEVGARAGNAGLYIYAGGLHSNGLSYGQDVFNKHIYGKLSYALLPSTDLNVSVFYQNNRYGDGDFTVSDPPYISRNRDEHYFATLSVTTRLTSDLTADATAWTRRSNASNNNFDLSGGPLSSYFVDDRMYGANAKVAWKLGDQKIVAGAEYNYWIEKANSDILIDGKQHLEKWAVFANDTITWGSLALTPGLRYEATSIGGNALSPSLGATYQLTKRTVLRASVANGFYVPSFSDKYYPGVPVNPDLKVTRVWSYQAGAETGELKYIWLKASVFRHDIKDMIEYDDNGMSVNTGKQRRQGIEFEAKTLSYYNTWLSGGVTFTDARDSAHEIVKGVPRYTYDVALNYDDKKSFKAMIRGRYVWWNADLSSNGKYSSFLFDITAAKKIFTYDRHSVEIIGSVHNIFNDNQYYIQWYKSPRRWAEVGLRYKF